jgi:imidazolonepropionase-like amidohydrolase
MRRKNIPLILVVVVAAILFLRPTLSEKFPASPGYRVAPYVPVKALLVALTHVRIVDGTGTAPLQDSTVILSHGRIQSINNSETTSVPAGAEVLDLTGYTVIPGLVGMHDHMFYGGEEHLLGFSGWTIREMAFAFPRLYLASGVTTIRTAGALDASTDLRLKDQIDKGWIVGPKIFATGPYFDNVTPDQARKGVATWADKGATSFKAYTSITRAALAATIEAAHQRGLKVTADLCAVGFREAISLGIDNLEHGLLVDTEFDPHKTLDVCPPRLRMADVASPA